MQLQRVLLLFALVLGLSAVVASIAPPPEDSEERTRDAPAVEERPRSPRAGGAAGAIRVVASARPRRGRIETRRAPTGSRLSVEVTVPRTGDVTIAGLGLRQTADPLAPARFDFVASRPGRHAVVFAPVRGRARVVGRVELAVPATVTPRAPGR